MLLPYQWCRGKFAKVLGVCVHVCVCVYKRWKTVLLKSEDVKANNEDLGEKKKSEALF